jgi:hypothetical protein
MLHEPVRPEFVKGFLKTSTSSVRTDVCRSVNLGLLMRYVGAGDDLAPAVDCP